MTTTSHAHYPLWEFGWCDYDRLVIPQTKVAEDVIRAYLQSHDFGVDCQLRPEPELHGPFWRAQISEVDFELISPERFEELIEPIRRIETVSDERWQAIQRLVSEVRAGNSWFFSLRFTEDDSDRFHDWGWVLGLFREFICASPDSGFAERLVFGYD